MVSLSEVEAEAPATAVAARRRRIKLAGGAASCFRCRVLPLRIGMIRGRLPKTGGGASLGEPERRELLLITLGRRAPRATSLPRQGPPVGGGVLGVAPTSAGQQRRHRDCQIIVPGVPAKPLAPVAPPRRTPDSDAVTAGTNESDSFLDSSLLHADREAPRLANKLPEV